MRISDWSSDVCSSDLSIDRYVTQTFDVEYGTTEYGAEAYEAYLRERYVALGATPEQIERIVPRNVERYLADPYPFDVSHTGIWEPDADGNFHRADNICLNGSLASVDRKSTRLNSSH